MITPTGYVPDTWGEVRNDGARTKSGEPRKQIYRRTVSSMRSERGTFDSTWKELAGFVKPSRARFITNDVNRGDRRWSKIIDATGTFSARTLGSGMMSGVTSPARPWFRLTVADYELAEHPGVRIWLDEVRDIIVGYFDRSNLYKELPTIYQDMGVFGTGAMLVMEDPQTAIHCYDFPVGSFMLGNDAKNKVRTCAREFRLTVGALVERFGTPDARGNPDWSKFSDMVKAQYDRSNYDTWIDVTHIITPNRDADPSKLSAKYKPYSSCYYESAAPGDGFLEERGFDEFPVLAPRWEVAGEDVYGTECPGMIALGDIKSLQLMEKRGLQAIEKMVNPPMVAQPGMRASKLTQISGEVSYVVDPEGKGLRPLHEVNFRLEALGIAKQETRFRIQRAFYEDLFLMLDQLDRKQITATEILERKQEKLLALGPVLEQLNQDMLDPLIDRVFAILLRANLLPPAPPELEGQTLTPEYVSIMAQAQKETGLGALDRVALFAGNYVKMTGDPSILDKIDPDQMVDEYAEMTGVPARVIVSDEDVAAKRQARAQQQQMAQAAENAKTVAGAAQSLAASDTSGKNALTDILGTQPAAAA